MLEIGRIFAADFPRFVDDDTQKNDNKKINILFPIITLAYRREIWYLIVNVLSSK